MYQKCLEHRVRCATRHFPYIPLTFSIHPVQRARVSESFIVFDDWARKHIPVTFNSSPHLIQCNVTPKLLQIQPLPRCFIFRSKTLEAPTPACLTPFPSSPFDTSIPSTLSQKHCNHPTPYTNGKTYDAPWTQNRLLSSRRSRR